MSQKISGLQNTLIYHLIQEQAESNPDAIAIIAPKRPPLTYRQLWNQINNIVTQLNAIGVERNDRVAITLNNGPEMAVAFLAIASAATCAPLNPNYSQREFDFYLSDLNAKALIIQAGVAEAAITVARDRDIPIIELSPILEAEAGIFTLTGGEPKQPEQNSFAQADDIALVLHTSGTTSRPKIVPLTHRNLCASAQNIRTALQLEKGDRCLNFMPLFHIHGLIGALLSSLSAGASIICTPGFYAPKFFEWLEEFRPTWYSAVPTMHQAILARATANCDIISRCPIRFIRSSSAALAPLVMAELEKIFNAPVIEAYGMTEASHQMASNPLPPQVRKAGSVGVAAGPEIAIMDEVGNLLNQGEIGEIVIRGDNVTLGYENNPKANETAFTNGWFRTGDQGYLDSDRYLFIKGRLKEIINRGGEKISPREVDEVLLNHPEIASVVTFAIPHTQLGEEVGAAVVLRENASATEREIQEFAAAQMADFKVPRRVIFLDEIPKGPTGKLQRIGLAEKLGIAPLKLEESSIAFAPPSTLEEEKLTKIWLEVLGLKKIGVRDNFFQLGGDSILGLQIINRVRSQLQVELSFLSLWQNPTIAEIAVEITQQQTQPTEPIQPISRERELPLSFAQTRLWFLDQLEPGNPAYNRPVVVRLVGKLNVTALEGSLNEIVRRHEVLRTTFPANVEGFPVQAIAPTLTLSLPLIDLSKLPETQREAEAKKQVELEVQRSFNLEKGPLVRANLWQLNVEKYLLFVGIHHIVFDGWSLGILLHEIAAIYEAFCAGKPSPLPELPIQYADFSSWQQQWLSGEVLESQLAYWKQQLSGNLPRLQLPAERSQTPVGSFRGATQSFQLSPQLSDALNKLSCQEGVTLFMTLLAAFGTLLYRYTSQDDIAIGTDVANRLRVETENLIGFFVNLVVMRVDLRENPNFRELLDRIRQMTLEAYAHQELPFEKLVEELQPEREINRTPLFQVLFVLENAPILDREFADVTLSLVKLESGTTVKFDLALFVTETERGISGTWQYNSALFDANTIRRMSEHLETLLGSIAAQPDARLNALEIFTEAEKKQQIMQKTNRQKNKFDKFKNVQPKLVSFSPEELIKADYLQPGETLPLAIAPAGNDIDLAEWTHNSREFIETKLLHHGALLFRGFPINSVAEFEQIAQAICPQLFGEYGDLPRAGISGKVYASTPYPADKAILFHNESSHLHRWPIKIWFFCVQPAQQGGETPIVDCRKIYQLLDPQLRKRFEEKQIMYVRNYTDGLDVSWQEFFKTTEKAVVEDYCRSAGIDWEWKTENALKTRKVRPAIAPHPKTGEMVFFNQLPLHHISCLDSEVRASLLSIFGEENLPRHVYYGDGTPIEDSVMEEIQAAYRQAAVSFPWQAGDILMLDNMLVAHSRNPFIGARKIVVAMGEMMNETGV